MKKAFDRAKQVEDSYWRDSLLVDILIEQILFERFDEARDTLFAIKSIQSRETAVIALAIGQRRAGLTAESLATVKNWWNDYSTDDSLESEIQYADILTQVGLFEQSLGVFEKLKVQPSPTCLAGVGRYQEAIVLFLSRNKDENITITNGELLFIGMTALERSDFNSIAAVYGDVFGNGRHFATAWMLLSQHMHITDAKHFEAVSKTGVGTRFPILTDLPIGKKEHLDSWERLLRYDTRLEDCLIAPGLNLDRLERRIRSAKVEIDRSNITVAKNILDSALLEIEGIKWDGTYRVTLSHFFEKQRLVILISCLLSRIGDVENAIAIARKQFAHSKGAQLTIVRKIGSFYGPKYHLFSAKETHNLSPDLAAAFFLGMGSRNERWTEDLRMWARINFSPNFERKILEGGVSSIKTGNLSFFASTRSPASQQVFFKTLLKSSASNQQIATFLCVAPEGALTEHGLMTCLASSDPLVVLNSASKLLPAEGRKETSINSIVNALKPLVRNADPEIRYAATRLLSQQTEVLFPGLDFLLEDVDPDVRYIASKICGVSTEKRVKFAERCIIESSNSWAIADAISFIASKKNHSVEASNLVASLLSGEDTFERRVILHFATEDLKQ